MAAEKIDQKKTAIKQSEKDFAITNATMQDRVKMDGKFGTLESKEKAPKMGKKQLIGPN